MMFNEKHIFINGESFSASGRDAQLMRRLSDARYLSQKDFALTSTQAQGLLSTWQEAGWMHRL